MTKRLDNDFRGQKQPEQPLLPFAAGQVDRCGLRLTRAEFARLLSCSKQAVGEWVTSGKITLGADGRLDPRQAVAQLLRRTDPAKLRARVLAPMVRDIGVLQRQVAELKARLAQAEEDRDFYEGSASELLRVPDLLLQLLAEEWASLRTIELSELKAALDDLFRRAGDLAAQEAEPEPLIPGTDIYPVTAQEEAWLAQAGRELTEECQRAGIEVSRASHEDEGEGGAA